MNIWIIFGLNLINQISAIEINGKNYKSVKGTKANLNVTKVIKARSVVQCASHCSNAEGCARANFQDSTCELLDFVPGMGDIELVEEKDSKYIYLEACNTLECQNGGGCVSTESGVRCECPSGYFGALCDTEWTLAYNGKHYVAVIDALSWFDARDNCTARGGRLAEVCEPELNDALFQVLEDRDLQDRYVWLGGSDEQNEGHWEWVNDSCNWEWTDWGPRYGSAAFQNCLCIRQNVRWNDCACSLEKSFICEF